MTDHLEHLRAAVQRLAQLDRTSLTQSVLRLDTETVTELQAVADDLNLRNVEQVCRWELSDREAVS